MNDPFFSNQPEEFGDAAIALDETAPLACDIETMQWILDEVRAEKPLPLAEAAAVVASLFMEQRGLEGIRVQLAAARDPRSYHAVHALNVAMLSMAMGDELQFDLGAIRRIGLAALLHDVGMMRVPAEVVGKQGQITPEERERVKSHPIEGARILLAAGRTMDLPAVVAFEHHLKMDGSGYPRVTFPRSPHYISRLVQVCDVYEALSSARPYRPAWPIEIILSYLNERAGFEFHPALTAALSALIQRGVVREAAETSLASSPPQRFRRAERAVPLRQARREEGA